MKKILTLEEAEAIKKKQMEKGIFNWQELMEQHRGDDSIEDLIQWLIIETLTRGQQEDMKGGMSKEKAEKKWFTDLGVTTENWTKVKLTMQINGVEVPVMGTLGRFQESHNDFIGQEAKKILDKALSFSGLYNALDQAKRQILQELRGKGVEIPGDE